MTGARIAAAGVLLASLTLWGPAAAPRAASAPPPADWGGAVWGEAVWDWADWGAAGLGPEPGGHPADPGAAAPWRPPSPAAAWVDVSSGYLTAVAMAESGRLPRARASTSSAAGPYQFIDQTWLLTLHRYGPSLGVGLAASFVQLGADGRARVANADVRAALLALRYDPAIAGLMAAALTRENARTLAARLGRPPTGAELYAAHLLGPGQALQLLAAARLTPAVPAAAIFPAAAASNRGLFYDGGAARTARELVNVIVARGGFGGPAIVPRPAGVRAGDELVNLPPESASY